MSSLIMKGNYLTGEEVLRLVGPPGFEPGTNMLFYGELPENLLLISITMAPPISLSS
jgi:hypothetical protein